jgi:MFS family permease
MTILKARNGLLDQAARAAAGGTDVADATEDSLAYRGWTVVAGAFLQSFAAFFVAYSFAAFALLIERQFLSSRAEVVAIFALYTALMLMLAPLGGMVADRFGTRVSCLIGTAIMAAGLLLAASSSGLGVLLLCYGGLVGIGLAFVYVPCFAVVPRWFTRRRGLASGIAASGAAAGTVLGVPLSELLIGAVGWQSALALLAIGLLVVGTTGALMLAESPSYRGATAVQGPSLGEAVRGPGFRRFAVANVLGALALLTPLAQLVPHARSIGLEGPMVGYLMSLIGLGSFGGRLLLAPLSDRIGRVRSFGLLFGALGVSCLLWASADGLLVLGAFALLYGTIYGAIISLRASVTADLFRCRSMTTLTGLFTMVASLGTLAGTMVMGFSFDLLGGYRPAILVIGAGALVAGLVMLPLGRRPAA